MTPGSEISKLNAAGDSWFSLSKTSFFVISEALRIAEWTNGAFDPTTYSLVNLWGFHDLELDQSVPENGALRETLAWTGHNQLEIHRTNRQVKKARREVKLDLSGIGKGFAVDQISAYLAQKGVGEFSRRDWW